MGRQLSRRRFVVRSFTHTTMEFEKGPRILDRRKFFRETGYRVMAFMVEGSRGYDRGLRKLEVAESLYKADRSYPIVYFVCLSDSGSTSHLCNSVNVFIKGSERECDVAVCGVNDKDEKTAMHSYLCGDVLYRLGSMSVVLTDVLYCHGSVLGESEDSDEPTVLISVKRMAAESSIGTHYCAGGELVQHTDNKGKVVASFTPQDGGLYTHKQRLGCEGKASHEEAYRAMAYFQSEDESEDEKESVPKAEGKASREEAYRAIASFQSEDESEDEKHSGPTDKGEGELSCEEGKLSREEACRSMAGFQSEDEEEPSPKEGKSEQVKGKDKTVRVKPTKDKLVRGKLVKSKRHFASILHRRIHYGRTQHTHQFLKHAYGDGCIIGCEEACDACMWAKAKYLPMPVTSHRKAKRVGERLHLDVFKGPCRSDDGCLYLLVVIDEFSGYVVIEGMKKKSEVKYHLKTMVLRLEKKVGDGVASFRCDGGGENINNEFVAWCEQRGTVIEKTVPYSPNQNGKAERVGGVVLEGEASLRYGGNLPDDQWLRCSRAFVHMRNRMPSKSCLHPNRTPYEVWEDVDLKPLDLIGHFRIIGSLAYRLRNRKKHAGRPKRSQRCMFLGYLEGQKGYLARRLSDGKLMTATHSQLVFKEDILVYSQSPDYDSWLRKSIKRRDRNIPRATHHEENKGESESESSSGERELAESEGVDGDEVSGESEEEEEDESEEEEEEKEEEEASDGDEEKSIVSETKTVQTGQSRRRGRQSVRNKRQLRRSNRLRNESSSSSSSQSITSDSEDSGTEVKIEKGDDTSTSEDAEVESDSNSETGDGYYSVNAITGHRKGRGRRKLEYETVWEGNWDNTWEPKSSFKDSKSSTGYLHVLNEYKREKGIDEDENETGGLDISSQQVYEDMPELETSDDPEYSEHKSQVNKVIRKCLRVRIELCKAIKGGVDVPDTRERAKISDFWPQFAKAERVELDAFVEPDVWVLMPRPKGVNVIGTRWVYDVKLDSDGNVTRYKARLVAQGFSQKKGIDYSETFAPTMHIKTMRVLLTLAGRLGLEVRQYDVSNAFLHADIDCDVYVRQPPGHKKPGQEDWVYKLNKAMYGLKNAPKAYSDYFMKLLAEQGFQQSKQDECLWTLRKGESFVHYLYHVDDIMVVSNDRDLRESCLAALANKLPLRDDGPINEFLGVKVTRCSDSYYEISQKKYIEKVAARFNVDQDTKQVSTPEIASRKLIKATEEEKGDAQHLEFQELVGCLIYANMSRPDIAYPISNVARFMGGWNKEHYDAALRILSFLYTTRTRTLVLKPANESEPMLWGYVDANNMDSRESEVNDDKWKPQGGYIMVWDGCIVSWRSARLKSRVLSSMESEYYQACEGAKEVIWLRRLVSELGFDVMNKPTPIYEDNKACIAYSKNNTCHDRTKHIDNKAYFLRDQVKNGEIELIHIGTNDQLADMMTKTQEKRTFLDHTERLFSDTLQQPKRSYVSQVRTEVKNSLLKEECSCLSCFVGNRQHVTKCIVSKLVRKLYRK